MKFVLFIVFITFLNCHQKTNSGTSSPEINKSTKNSIHVKDNPPEKQNIENQKSVVSEKQTKEIKGSKSSMLKSNISFEDMNHFLYPLTPQKHLIINDQVKMDEVYALIHKKSGGGRVAPIPTLTGSESYLIFKPELKNTNDIEIQEIYIQNNVLNVIIKPFDDPQRDKSSRIIPNVLVKLLQKTDAQNVSINYR